jgi:hypothetical protein
MDDPGNTPKRFFSKPPPESASAGRRTGTQFVGHRPEPSNRPALTGAQLRLYAWTQLPDRHRNEVCRQIRMRCEAFVSSVRVERSQRKTEVDRLVSEVVAHLLRATSLPREDAESELPAMPIHVPAQGQSEIGRDPSPPLPWLVSGRLDQFEPMRDARVIWVIEETCNRQALFHRHEDVRRRDRGGKWDGSGYPLVAVDDQTIEQLSGHYDPAEQGMDMLDAEDARQSWRGLAQLAEHHFGAEDDVVALIQVLAQDRETQDSFGSQWPIGQIVRVLNAGRPAAAWSDDRVENAKRRLTKFIVKFKDDNGLDAVDLRALLARYARQRRVTAASDSQRTGSRRK